MAKKKEKLDNQETEKVNEAENKGTEILTTEPTAKVIPNKPKPVKKGKFLVDGSKMNERQLWQTVLTVLRIEITEDQRDHLVDQGIPPAAFKAADADGE